MIIVQKYGGSSLSTPDHIRHVAKRVVETFKEGHKVVVVVSAMGKTTDQLLALAASVSNNPETRELDMLLTVGERISMSLLSMAIHDLGCPSVSFTGSQSGIITTNNHTDARIIRVTPLRIQKALDEGQIVIVAGFQGVSEELEITSLGRGGSDTTAVALAAALNADYAEICSDVDGVYSADPRVVPEAHRIDEMDYSDMQRLADAGAKVLNAEAVEWARRENIEIRCSATKERRPGTSIRQTGGLCCPRVLAVTAHPGLWILQGEGINFDALDDLLVAHGAGDAQVFTLGQKFFALIPSLNVHDPKLKQQLLALGTLREDLKLVTVVGRSLRSTPPMANKARACLQSLGIEPYLQIHEQSRLAWLVPSNRADALVLALHNVLCPKQAD